MLILSFLLLSSAPFSFRCARFAGRPPVSTAYKAKRGQKLQVILVPVPGWGVGRDSCFAALLRPRHRGSPFRRLARLRRPAIAGAAQPALAPHGFFDQAKEVVWKLIGWGRARVAFPLLAIGSHPLHWSCAAKPPPKERGHSCPPRPVPTLGNPWRRIPCFAGPHGWRTGISALPFVHLLRPCRCIAEAYLS